MFKIREAASFLLLVVLASACNLPWEPAVVDSTDPVPTVGTDTSGLSLAATFTPSTMASDLVNPFVSVSVDTNCRTGPGTVYPALGVLTVGQTAEVVGRSASSDNWIIKLPSNPAVTCWLWGNYATVTGDTSGLTVYTPPPTPTPAAGFTVSYTYTFECDSYYYLRFQIVNTGSVTWESYQVVITDLTTSITFLDSDNAFRNFTDCSPTSDNLHDLEPGEMGVGGNFNEGGLPYNPAGHSITATFTLFTENGLVGQSAEKNITFTP